jgi:Ala-tRNA(Pro) deacylase
MDVEQLTPFADEVRRCTMECKERLEQYLRENGVPYLAASHPPAFTAPEVAAAMHAPGKQVAKVVMIKAGDSLVMCVLPANAHINLRLLADLLNTPDARLAHEEEFSALFPDCLLGAMPPFGNLYGIPVYLDTLLTDDPEIIFQAGSHTDTIRIRYADYVRLAKPQIASFALQKSAI